MKEARFLVCEVSVGLQTEFAVKPIVVIGLEGEWAILGPHSKALLSLVRDTESEAVALRDLLTEWKKRERPGRSSAEVLTFTPGSGIMSKKGERQ